MLLDVKIYKMIKKMYKKLRYVTCKAKKLLVHPVETFVEEAGKLVTKRNTVTVVKAALVSDRMIHTCKESDLV